MSTTVFRPDAALSEGVLARRVGAWVLDLVAVGILVLALWLVLVAFGVLTLGLAFPLMGVLPAVPIAYHILFVAGRGSATPGQRLMDLTVRRDADFGTPSLLQAVLFTAGLWLTLGAGVVWLAAALFTANRRALHDIVAGVIVVRRSAVQAAAHGPLTGGTGFGNMRWGPPNA